MRADATLPIFALYLATSCVLRTPTLTASGLRVTVPVTPPAAEPLPSTVAVDRPSLIEAGCTFTGLDIKGEPGSLHRRSCPAGCDKTAFVRGTDDYAADSPVCVAAMHAPRMIRRAVRRILT